MPFSRFPIPSDPPFSKGEVLGSDVKIVNSEADFPAPVGGVITLDPDVDGNTCWLIGTSVVITSGATLKIAPGKLVSFTGYDSACSVLTTISGTAPTIDITGATITTQFMTWNNLGNQPIFFAGASAGAQIFAHRLVINNCSKVSVTQDMVNYGITECRIVQTASGCFEFSGSNSGFQAQTTLIDPIVNGPFLDLGTATFDVAMSIEAVFLSPGFAGDFITGQANNGNLDPGVIATVTGCNTLTSGAGLIGVSRDDTQWLFTGNDGIADSRPEVFISVQNNATETVINTTGVREQIVATFTEVVASQATTTAAGRSTFNNDIPYVGLRCSFSGNARSTTGSPEYEILIFKNGAAIAESRVTFENPSNQTNNFAVNIPVDVIDGDFFEVFVANLTNTTNITFENIQFSIS